MTTWEPQDRVDVLMVRLKEPDARVRAAAACELGEIGESRADLLKALSMLARDPSPEVVRAGFNAVRRIAPANAVSHARAVLANREHRVLGAELLVGMGGDSKRVIQEVLLWADMEDSRAKILLEVAVCESPSLVEETLVYGDMEDSRAIAILDTLMERQPSRVERLIREGWPLRDREATSRAWRMNELLADRVTTHPGLSETSRRELCATIVEAMIDDEFARGVGRNVREKLMNAAGEVAQRVVFARAQSKDDEVRARAVRLAAAVGDARAERLLIRALEDPYTVVRGDALEELAARADLNPAHLTSVRPLALDQESDQVREEALRVLARFDDPRALGELIFALDDPEPDVSGTARRLLTDGAARDQSPGRPGRRRTATPTWELRVAEMASIKRWAVDVSMEILGKPVRVSRFRGGIGMTPQGGRGQGIEVFVNPMPLFCGHPHGGDIVRGIVLHELGHHLCDIGVRGHKTMQGIAESEGILRTFNILLDERLERKLRSRRAEWGTYFDRLASFAFTQEAHHIDLGRYALVIGRSPEETAEAIQGGELPGNLVRPDAAREEWQVALRDRALLTIPGLMPASSAFLTCLRCGFDPAEYPDPVVAEAMALVPGNLKDLPHAKVLEAAREIARRLGGEAEQAVELQRLWQIANDGDRSLEGLSGILERLSTASGLPERTKGAARRAVSGSSAEEVLRRIFGRPRYHSKPRPRSRRELPNLNPDLDFEPLPFEESLCFDPAAHASVVAMIGKHIRRMRHYFERLGRRSVEQYASRTGRRVDMARARRAALVATPNILVQSLEETAPNTYLGILIDRSGSMDGKKLDLARAFGVLVAESAGGVRGIEGHVNAFDDDTFYGLGDLRRNAIASLTAGGGNNDAGGLAKAADLAVRSRKERKTLVMISDGAPTECSVESLRALVQRLTRKHGIACAQVAVDKIEPDDVAFTNLVDLSDMTLVEAVTRFGNLLIRLTSRPS